MLRIIGNYGEYIDFANCELLSLIFRHHCASLIKILSVKYKYRELYELLTRLNKSLIFMGTAWFFDYDVLGHYNTFRLLNCLFDGKIGTLNIEKRKSGHLKPTKPIMIALICANPLEYLQHLQARLIPR